MPDPTQPLPIFASCSSSGSGSGGGSSELAKQRCVPCEADGGGLEFMGLCEALSQEEASKAAAALEPAWEVVPLPQQAGDKSGDGEPGGSGRGTTSQAGLGEPGGSGGGAGGLALQREFRCRNFLAAVELCHRMGQVAEEEKHHPDLHITGWNRLRVTLSTHSRNGVTRNDLVLAAKLNALEVSDLLRTKKKPKFEDA